MDVFKKKLIVTAILSSFALPTIVHATNGMQSIGNGAKAQGMGGAGVARANENGSIVTNPAAVIGVGDQLDTSITFFSASPRGYKITGNEAKANNVFVQGSFNSSQTSENDLFLIPFFGMTFPVNEKSSLALSMAAAGGMNTEYKTNFGAGITTRTPKLTKETGLNLEQVYVTSTYGRKLNEDTSVGVSVIYAYQRFEATGLQIFEDFGATETIGKLTNNGIDESSGVGYKVGSQTGFGDFRLGVSYQPRIKMTKFNKYSSLFANQGEFDIPATINAGFAWKIFSKFTIAFDYQNINYDDIETFSNSIKKFTDDGKLFGSTNGPGFGWRSIDVYKLGFEYNYSDDWTFRTGWNKGDNPVQKGEVSLAFLAPAIITDHFTAGFTNKIDGNSSYSMNFVHSYKNSMTDDFSEKFGGGTITIEMEQNALELGYSKLF